MIAPSLLLELAFAALGLVALCVAVVPAVPTYSLIALIFLVQVWQDTWSVGGVLFDSLDVMFALIAVSLLVRGLPHRASVQRSIPRLGAWLGLVALISAAYATSPDGGPNMTDPLRIVYQLYRYAFRITILYPLACLLLDSPRKFDHVLTCVVLAASVFAVMSIVEGYTGQRVNGPFLTKNALGAAIAVPVVLVLADLICGRLPALSLLSLPLLLRSALFVSSRGAFAGIVVGTATTWWFMRRGRVRTRLGGLVAAGVVLVVVGMLVRPDFLERPNVARVFSTADLGQDTLKWRINERWPHFARRALQHPWLGWGSDVDLELGPSANTSHNGYLSLANTFGIPVLALYMLFCTVAIRDAWTASARTRYPEDRVRAAKIAGAFACMLTHNLVDSVLGTPFVGSELWVFAAVAASLAAHAPEAAPERAPAASRRPVLALGAGS